ncbi:MAG: hypothetical protein ACI8P0_001312 [Planctomycetaceae bacterium]
MDDKVVFDSLLAVVKEAASAIVGKFWPDVKEVDTFASVANTREHKKFAMHRWLNCLYGPNVASPLLTLLHPILWLLTISGPAVVTMAEFCDPSGQHIPAPFEGLSDWVYRHRLVVVMTVLSLQVVTLLACFVLKKFNALKVDACQEILNSIVAQHFASQNLSTHTYRATIFQIRGFRRLGGQWLGIAGRSGQNYVRSNTVFSIHDMKKIRNTGVCGECVRQGGNTLHVVLPEPEDEEYKVTGFVSSHEFKRINVKSVVFYATGVFVSGKLWGVLVLDSTDRGQVPNQQTRKRFQDAMGIYAVAIRALLV